jgi:hypothetical protein
VATPLERAASAYVKALVAGRRCLERATAVGRSIYIIAWRSRRVDWGGGNLVKRAARNDNSVRFGIDAVRATQSSQSKEGS